MFTRVYGHTLVLLNSKVACVCQIRAGQSIFISGDLIHLVLFCQVFTRETTFVTSSLCSCTTIPSEKGFSLKRKESKFFIFWRRSLFRREPSLKVYLFPLISQSSNITCSNSKGYVTLGPCYEQYCCMYYYSWVTTLTIGPCTLLKQNGLPLKANKLFPELFPSSRAF